MANKYRAKRTTTPDGVSHDSKREAARWMDLQMLERAGEIRNLKRQVAIPLEGRDAPLLTRTGRKMRITVDFTYEDKRKDWALVHEDSKGTPTRDYEVRRSVLEAMGIRIIET